MDYSEISCFLKKILLGVYSDTHCSDYCTLYAELERHTVSSLAGKWIRRDRLPPDVYAKWALSVAREYANYHSTLGYQVRLAELLEGNGIGIAILKGSAASAAYPYPELRKLGDIDFMVSENQFDQAYHILLENGYRLLYDEDHEIYHYTLGYGNMTFEIHRYPAGVDEMSEKDMLIRIFEDGMKTVIHREQGRYTVPMFPSLQNGLVLLLHIRKHIKSGLGLRQIVDWMMYVKNELRDEQYRIYESVYKDTGLDQLAKLTTKMCQMYLGLSDQITWCRDADETLCSYMYDCIMAQGNFGNKQTREEQISVGLSRGIKKYASNPGQIFLMLRKNGIQQWKYGEKHPLLAGFWMAKTYVVLLFKRMCGGHFLNDQKQGNKREKLFRALHIG